LSTLKTARGQWLNDLKLNQNISANQSRREALLAEKEAILAQLFGARQNFALAYA